MAASRIPDKIKILGRTYAVDVSGRGYVGIDGIHVDLDKSRLDADSGNWDVLLDEAFRHCRVAVKARDKASARR